MVMVKGSDVWYTVQLPFRNKRLIPTAAGRSPANGLWLSALFKSCLLWKELFSQRHSPFPGRPASSDGSVRPIKTWGLISVQDSSQGLSRLRAPCGGSAGLYCAQITAQLFLLPKPICFPPQLLIPGAFPDNLPAHWPLSQNQLPGGHNLWHGERSSGQKYILNIFWR